MMGEMNPEIKSIVSDYKMHLVEVLRTDTEQFQNQEVKQVMEYAQAFMKRDLEQVERLSQQYITTLEVAYMVGKITKSQEVMKQVMKKQRLEVAEEEMDMCEFITELIEDGEKRGRKDGEASGMVLTLRLLNYQNDVIVRNLIENLGLTEKQAMEYIV